MTWHRIVTNGFESGTPNELNAMIGIISFVDAAASRALTGYYGGNAFSSENVGAQVFPAAYDQIRMGFLCRPDCDYIQPHRLIDLMVVNGNEAHLIVIWSSVYEHLLRMNYYPGDTSNPTALDFTYLHRPGLYYKDTRVAFGLTYKKNQFVTLYINGEPILTYTGSLLASLEGVIGVAINTTMAFDGNSTYDYFDDIYIDYSDTPEDDACPPLYRFGFVRPDAAGTTQEWDATAVTHHEAIDDYPPDDADFVYTSTPGETELFGCAAFTLPTYHDLTAVLPMARVKKGNAQEAGSLQLAVYDPATLAVSLSLAYDLPVGYEYHSARFALDPNGSAWGLAQVNACEYGVVSAV